MNSSSMFLFALFSLVALVAVGMMFYNRQRMRHEKMEYQEPMLGINTQIANTKAAVAKLDQTISSANADSQSLDDPLYDPIVGEFVPTTSVAKSKPIIKSRPAVEIRTDEIIALSLLARPDRPYVGYELLQALLSAGLRFGKMNIFHRYHSANNNNGILFSLASAVEPGFFEMSKMGGFSSPGLTLFMRTSDSPDPLFTFDLMLETAKQLIEDLGGELCDEKRNPLSEDKVAQLRSRLLMLEETQQSEELFATS